MSAQRELEELIWAQCQSTGSLSAALQHAQAVVLSPEQQRRAVDVFPSSGLAGAVGQLCRCRGMIQEVQPEVNLFCASAQHFFSPTAAPTHFHPHSTDASGAPLSGSHHQRDGAEDHVEFVDTVSLYVIPVPGNDHFYRVEDSPRPSEAAHTTEGVSEDASMPPRRRREREVSEENTSSPVETRGTPREVKVVKTTNAAASGSSPEGTGAAAAGAGHLSLNLPHPSRHPQLQTACIVTVLLPPSATAAGDAERRRNPFRINDVIDFFGYQHFPDDQLPMNEEEAAVDDFARFSAWNAAELSKGLVSRLLCVAYSPVSSVHLPYQVAQSPLCEAAAMPQLRSGALQYLCEHITRGDDLVAEYLLLHLCSRVSLHSAALPVGDVPLLVTSPHICAEQWSRELRRISAVAEIFLDAKAFCADSPRLTPRYNNDLNYLESGSLQVANGSHVTVDCSAIGTPDDHWYEGTFALVHRQLLLLEYPFQTLELPVDVSVLALTTSPTRAAVHPVFQFALCVPWQPARSPAAETVAAADAVAETADAVRAYIAAVRRLPASAAAVNDDVSSQASSALLEMSREMPRWNNRDPLLHNNSFSAATALMRAHAASCGRANFTAADIAAVRRLESARASRLDAMEP